MLISTYLPDVNEERSSQRKLRSGVARFRSLAERPRSVQRRDLVLAEVDDLAKHGCGIGSEFRSRRCDAAETCLPRQARQDAGAVRFPEAALREVIHVDQVPRIGERCRSNTGPQQ